MKRSIHGLTYVAGPLGFSEAGRAFYYKELIPMLEKIGLKILDPWKLTDPALINSAASLPEGKEKIDKWRQVNEIIGKNNADAIDRAELVIAVLDGTDVDSGTSGEVGYAAKGAKFIEGYRGDFRLSADNCGSTVNLQVEYFICMRGKGKISLSLVELEKRLKETYEIS